MKVYITGDLHGEKAFIESIPERCPELGSGDILIIAGDFGLPWWSPDSEKSWEDKKLLNMFSNYNFTTCFVDGNHENFDYLRTVPYESHWGGQVQKIIDNVYHLCRGEIYTMNGKTIFTFGGATSADKMYRTEHISWWQEENASQAEKDYGLTQLESLNWNVNYVITHTAPEQLYSVYKNNLFNKKFLHCPTQAYLTELFRHLDFDKWYFGHFHNDINSDRLKCRLLFNEIIELGQ